MVNGHGHQYLNILKFVKYLLAFIVDVENFEIEFNLSFAKQNFDANCFTYF